MKKNVLISYVVEADTDLKAVFELQKSLRYLPDSELIKFDAFEVLDVKENN
jgi:hypothetical protein